MADYLGYDKDDELLSQAINESLKSAGLSREDVNDKGGRGKIRGRSNRSNSSFRAYNPRDYGSDVMSDDEGSLRAPDQAKRMKLIGSPDPNDEDDLPAVRPANSAKRKVRSANSSHVSRVAESSSYPSRALPKISQFSSHDKLGDIYKPPHRIMFAGSFDSLVSKAVLDRKWILVSIQRVCR
jgi:hypothetical protein